jgi:hypothetical protein
MTKKTRLVAIVGGVIAGVVVLAASAHAAAGPVHEAGVCLACSLCEWLNGVLG